MSVLCVPVRFTLPNEEARGEAAFRQEGFQLYQQEKIRVSENWFLDCNLQMSVLVDFQ